MYLVNFILILVENSRKERRSFMILNSLFKNGEECDIADDGYVGDDFNEGDQVLIRTAIPSDMKDIWALTVDGGRNITEKRNKPGYAESSQGRIFQLKITVLKKQQPVGWSERPPYTASPSNTHQLLHLKPSGIYQLWKNSLFAQKGKFFFKMYKSFSGCCYEKEGMVVCPQFEEQHGAYKDWKQMVDFLRKRVDIENLSPIEEYKPEPKITVSRPNIGIIKHWDLATGGNGVAVTEQEDVSVNWREVAERKGSRLIFLSPLDVIEFDELEPYITKRPSKIRMKAVGVRLINDVLFDAKIKKYDLLEQFGLKLPKETIKQEVEKSITVKAKKKVPGNDRLYFKLNLERFMKNV